MYLKTAKDFVKTDQLHHQELQYMYHLPLQQGRKGIPLQASRASTTNPLLVFPP